MAGLGRRKGKAPRNRKLRAVCAFSNTQTVRFRCSNPKVTPAHKATLLAMGREKHVDSGHFRDISW